MSSVETIKDPAELPPHHYLSALEWLLRAARADGVILRIENVPMRPLAMGNFTQVAYADLDNAIYRKEQPK